MTIGQVSGMVVGGVGLNFITKLGGIALALVLVRLVAKEDYGAFGIVSAIVSFLMTASAEKFAENSFFVGQDEDPRFDLHLGFALCVHGVMSAVIVGIAAFYLYVADNSKVAYLLLFSALAPLLNAPRVVYSVYMQRQLDWKRIRAINLIAFIIASGLAITLASAGYGGLALTAQIVLTPVPFVIDMIRVRPDLLRVSFDFRAYRSSLSFGLFRSSAAVLGRGRDLVEAFLITAAVGLAGFGVYGRALGLAQLSAGWLGVQLSAIAYPMLAKLQPGTPLYRQASGLLVRLCFWSATPISLAMVLGKVAAVRVLYGSNWMEVIPLLPPMIAVVFSLTVFAALNVVSLGAVGAKFVFQNEAAAGVIAAFGLFVLLPRSIVAYLWFLAAGVSILGLGVAMRLVARGGLDGGDLLRSFMPSVVLFLIAFVFPIPASSEWAGDPHKSWIYLAGLNVAMIALMAAIVRLVDSHAVLAAIRFAPARLQRPLRVLLCFRRCDEASRA